jgi:hypothetical protein
MEVLTLVFHKKPPNLFCDLHRNHTSTMKTRVGNFLVTTLIAFSQFLFNFNR